MKRPLIALLSLFLFLFSASAGQKVACVGDSITFGMLVSRGWTYPDQLQRMLGPDFNVTNFGVNGATLLRNGDRPYNRQPAFQAALASKPDIIILMLGANDAKPLNWGPHQAEFEPDYRWLIAQLQASSPAGILFICRPCWVAASGKYGITDPGIEQEIPIIDKIAASLHLTEIDMHAATQGHPEDFVDTVHPNKAGAALLALAAYKAITGEDFQGQVPPPKPASTP
jgi:lysophospholipase L1-like esterase